MRAPAQRYAAIAIVLHWAIAFAIALMIPLGWWMSDLAEDGVVSDGLFRAFQLHKSIGLTVLALSLVQIGWRIANPPPAFPEHMPAWERLAARTTHLALYGLMLALPLTGWIYVSAGWSVNDDAPLLVQTHWFGLFTVPHLFGLPEADAGLREAAAKTAMSSHSLLAWGAVALATLHALAALKHHFVDRDNILSLMAPFLRASAAEPPPAHPARLALLGGGMSLLTIAMGLALFTIAKLDPVPHERAAEPRSAISITDDAAPATATEANSLPQSTPAAAPQGASLWQVDAARSTIGFGFTYSDPEAGDTRFDGRFTRWRADIRFDPDHLDASSVLVTIETASATDGVPLHDRALTGPEWFNSAAHPTATFSANQFRRRQGDAYEARGELTIRGRNRTVTLPFTLSIVEDHASMRGQVTIDRRDFDVGKDTDADDMISRDVDIIIRIEATRAS